nr:mucin-like protein 1 isoform X2 [Macaca nemestrina]
MDSAPASGNLVTSNKLSTFMRSPYTTGSGDDEATEAETTAATTTTTTAAPTTATTAAPTTATTAASTTAHKGILGLPKWLQDYLKGKLFP